MSVDFLDKKLLTEQLLLLSTSMTSEAQISIDGMTCGACSSSITEALQNLPHVQDVSVSLITNEARVVYSSPTTKEELVSTIEDCGFEAKLIKNKELRSKQITTVFNVQGMTCGACSLSVTEALEKYGPASVSLLTNAASVKHSPDVAVSVLLLAIEDCGFEATVESTGKPQFTALSISGMTCGSCSASVTEALEGVPGVITVSVSLLTEEASVEHDTLVTAADLIEVVEASGFDALLIDAPDLEEEQVIFQIYGIEESTDLVALQYNVEAVLNSLPGVSTFQFIFKGEVAESTAQNPDTEDTENLIDELRVSLKGTGIRTLVDALNGIDPQIQFVILNSVDQSLTSQLKLLSRAKDIQYWRSTFFASLVFGIPVVLMSFTANTKFWKSLLLFHGLYVVSVLQLAITLHILFNLGSVFFKKFAVFIRHKGRNANMDVLVCLSTLISYLFSVYSIILSVWTGQTNKPPKVLFETTAMLVCFISFGKWIENKAKGATSTALSKLMSLTPTTCLIITDVGEYEEFIESLKKGEPINLATRNIAIDLIQTNDIAVVLPGGKVPADGVIVFGETEIDESIITGEAMPVHKRKGDMVIGGSMNGPHLMHLKVTRAGKNSQLHQIINIVKESQVNKAPVQRLADYVAARFVACVLLLSSITFGFWIIYCQFSHPDKLPKAFMKEENGKYFVCLKLAISVIVVACPCALGLAAPTAVMVGTGVGATHGALIKGGDILEKASSSNVILFDKTGTLTAGEMNISNYKQVLRSLTLDQWWNLVGSVEVNSEHPTGKAIAKGAKQHLKLRFEDDTFDSLISGFEVITGLGVKATVVLGNVAYSVTIGNKRLLVRDYPDVRKDLSEVLESDLAKSVMSVAHVVINGEYCGFLELVDTIKNNAKDVLDYLQHVENYQVGIVTGDNKEVAERIGAQLGIPRGNVFSEVSPIEKDKVITDLRARFGGPENISIVFVGDGINDAPALVQADIGMAISTGTDIAIDSAEVVLMGLTDSQSNDLFGVITALQVSNATFRKIKWNFVCATVYNFVMLPFAMGCFLPFNLMLPPAAAAGAMACSSISVVLNSLLLKQWRPPTIGGLSKELNWEEEEVGGQHAFTLKSSTLAEFNQIKRGKFASQFRLGKFRRSKIRLHNSGNYEMLPSAE